MLDEVSVSERSWQLFVIVREHCSAGHTVNFAGLLVKASIKTIVGCEFINQPAKCECLSQNFLTEIQPDDQEGLLL